MAADDGHYPVRLRDGGVQGRRLLAVGGSSIRRQPVQAAEPADGNGGIDDQKSVFQVLGGVIRLDPAVPRRSWYRERNDDTNTAPAWFPRVLSLFAPEVEVGAVGL